MYWMQSRKNQQTGQEQTIDHIQTTIANFHCVRQTQKFNPTNRNHKNWLWLETHTYMHSDKNVDKPAKCEKILKKKTKLFNEHRFFIKMSEKYLKTFLYSKIDLNLRKQLQV